MGAITGALVADAITSDTAGWTAGAMRSIDIAETMLSGAPVPVDLEPQDSIAAAVGLSIGPAPLLVETTTVAFVDAVRETLEHGVFPDARDPVIAKAAKVARTNSFVDAVAAAGGDRELARLIGAIVGLEGGLGAVPAHPVSTFRSPDNRRGRRYLSGLTNRLLGIERPNWYDPRNRRGPREVLPGLWVSNLFGLSRFTSDHPDGLVLSLCDDDGRIADHPNHITFHVDDTPRTDANPSLATVMDEVLREIGSARAASRPVLVHCRHGASRTGLVLRLVLVDELSLSADDAMTAAQCLWPHTSVWNHDWTREVERRAAC
jgi:hypothetical protein